MCTKPGAAPVRPEDPRQHNANSLINNGADGDAVIEYNQKLAQYNAEELAYHTCINAYVANAQVDLDMVRSKAGKSFPNLPSLKDYPAPDCGEPVNVPVAPIGSLDSLSDRVGNYNAKMAKYNKYVACMNTYMDNVQTDTNVIQTKVNKVISDSKQ